MIEFPEISPVAFEIGPLVVRWYSLSYMAGILLGWYYIKYLEKKPPFILSKKAYEDIIVYAVIGIIAGGRIGYILFYGLPHYIENPAEILMLWQGGMSFHGGLAGVILAIIIFARKFKIKFFAVTDLLAAATPIGLFFGRLANFINGELYGRVTTVSWGVVFPGAGDLPRHPSQIYEAVLEGLLLFVILFFLARFTSVRKKTGVISGVFLAGYGIARFIVEFFREPDAQLGLFLQFISMGQILCLPMILFGLFLIIRGYGSRANN